MDYVLLLCAFALLESAVNWSADLGFLTLLRMTTPSGYAKNIFSICCY